MFTSPRSKLLVASVLLVVLAVSAQTAGLSVAPLARIVLLTAVAGLGLWWLRRARAAAPAREAAPRLKVVQRAGLSPRCAVALLNLDGADYLVAYGDGFAQITRVRRRKSAEPKAALEAVPTPAGFIAAARRPRPLGPKSPRSKAARPLKKARAPRAGGAR